MAVQNVKANSTVISATFTAEERDLLEAFAAEQGIDDLSVAIPALLHELLRIHDEIWDAQFAQSMDVVNEMARRALEEDRAGLTENLDV